MNQPIRFGSFNVLPTVVKNLLIINGLFYLGSTIITEKFGLDLFDLLGLHYWTSDGFRPHQVITHMFMHGDFGHVFFNMFSLWMFGSVLENIWGSQRFLIFYLITGIGAAVIHNMTKAIDIYTISQHLTPEMIAEVKREGYAIMQQGKNYSDTYWGALNAAINAPTIGASGAVYGVLIGFGMLFPNTKLYLFFMIPVKAKYVIGGLILFELFQGFQNNPTDNIAHFAHLGGALIGFLLVKYWNKNNRKSFF